ncbi:MAG TPA: hypothetical protein VD885_06390 [Methylophilaceae bacterium]|nr:hypothetical protein [Methylophilaceae bacterium]
MKRALFALLLCLACVPVLAGPGDDLRARYDALTGKLQQNQFGAPLHLDSSANEGHVSGDIYARIDQPFSKVQAALADPVQGPAHWCDVLILHINTKSCRAVRNDDGATLTVHIGSKEEQALDNAFPVRFDYRTIAATEHYFRIELSAEDGPLSTSDYRITIEAVPLDDHRTFLHFRYAYAYGLAGRLAMKTYLATVGRDKVGFTITGHEAGKAQYIGGMLGIIERNTMRYYLAIVAYLDALAAPPAQRLEARLRNWYAGTERYARQLHEVGREDYLQMKREEIRRQTAAR